MLLIAWKNAQEKTALHESITPWNFFRRCFRKMEMESTNVNKASRWCFQWIAKLWDGSSFLHFFIALTFQMAYCCHVLGGQRLCAKLALWQQLLSCAFVCRKWTWQNHMENCEPFLTLVWVSEVVAHNKLALFNRCKTVTHESRLTYQCYKLLNQKYKHSTTQQFC